ncbi:RecX family transcriptional regulator [Brevibacillus fluminis]|uniref:RecX family transcriptional regulator n=1 Tax=Brevibacillus fluminis TaxID=511487 RepID=UPI003F89765C
MTLKAGQISSIVQHAKVKHRYHIYVNDEHAFDVHEDILVKYSLHKGKELDPALFAEILEEEERNRAYLYALRYLGFRPRTSAQVQSYLIEKGFPSSLAQEICKRCEEQGYLDDAAFAQQWVRERMLNKSRSLLQLRMELRQKGIAEDDIQEASMQVKKTDQVEAAARLLAKKLRNRTEPPSYEERQKLSAMLQRKGFTHEIIRQAFGLVQTEEESF